MLSNTLYRVPRRDGLQLLQKRGEGEATEMTSWRLDLPAGRREHYLNETEETVLVVQQGAATLSATGSSWHASRTDVFTDRATALYLPPGVELTVAAEEAFEAVLVSTPAKADGGPAVATPGDVVVNQRGKGTYTREVHDIFVRDPYARRLMVGETFNPPGHWSSFPPHKHDGKDGEPVLEEVYYYRVSPQQGFGQQMLYTTEGECTTHTVRDGDAVLLPYGYHPVSSPPGYTLYYLWAMAGAERRLALHEDPAHSWI